MNPAERVFLDAGLFIGALLAGDPRHAEARGIVEAARRGELAACTSVGVLAEVYAALTWVGALPRTSRTKRQRPCVPDGSAFPPTGLGYRPSRRGADAGAGRAAPAHRPPHPRRSARGDRPGRWCTSGLHLRPGRLAGLCPRRHRNRWTRIHPARASSMNGLKPYPEYKDSGVPWLGEVPGHWDVQPAKRCIASKDVREYGMQRTTCSFELASIVVRPDREASCSGPASFKTCQIIDCRRNVDVRHSVTY